jgi:SulP family sulfate permease
VAIVALPLAMALGIASGASPEKGLVTAVIAGFLISALGGSRVQIGGPHRRLCRGDLQCHRPAWL